MKTYCDLCKKLIAETRNSTAESYFAIIEAKTASLMSGCCRVGALLDPSGGRNAETLAAGKVHPDRFTPVGVIGPMNGGGAAELRSLVEQGCRAVRLYPLLHAYRLYDPFAHETCAAAAELAIPVIVCTRPMMNFRFATVPIEEVGELARRHPKTQFILSGPNYLTEARAAVLVMQQNANVAIEITCMQGLNALQRTVEAVGADRVLFGTGVPLHYPACNVAKLVHANLSEAIREAVGGGNALRLLGISRA